MISRVRRFPPPEIEMNRPGHGGRGQLSSGMEKEVQRTGGSVWKLTRRSLQVKGQYYANSSKCTHYGVPLAAGCLTDDGRLVCKAHGAVLLARVFLIFALARTDFSLFSPFFFPAPSSRQQRVRPHPLLPSPSVPTDPVTYTAVPTATSKTLPASTPSNLSRSSRATATSSSTPTLPRSMPLGSRQRLRSRSTRRSRHTRTFSSSAAARVQRMRLKD